MKATAQEKTNLTKEIHGLKAQLREALAESAAPEGVVDWRVEFAEVFDQNGGFDVAIANPPYVRQEDIGDNKPRLRQLYVEAVTGMSDLYCYFYARAVQLLRKNGMHIFVSSNSWLDVGYGAKLQEYLLKNVWIQAVFDSAVERQFSTASINTIISVSQRGGSLPSAQTRFVSLRDLFELAIADPNRQKVVVKTKDELWKAGLDRADSGFVGDKWGGKYLRAPDIFFTILEKGKGKLVRLGDIAEVRFGIKTGANEFFYLDKDKIKGWGIEEEFLKPVIKSPRECHSMVIHSGDFRFKLFMSHNDKRELKGSNALEYIKWGEKQGFHERPSCRGRQRWWDLGQRQKARINVNYLVDAVMRFFAKEDGFYVSDNFQEVPVDLNAFWQLAVSANSTALQLFANLTGRVNFGGGLMKIQTYEVAGLMVLDPNLLEAEVCKTALLQAQRLELDGADRRALDDVIFDILVLTAGEREAVYEAVAALVKRRLEKARSV